MFLFILLFFYFTHFYFPIFILFLFVLFSFLFDAYYILFDTSFNRYFLILLLYFVFACFATFSIDIFFNHLWPLCFRCVNLSTYLIKLFIWLVYCFVFIRTNSYVYAIDMPMNYKRKINRCRIKAVRGRGRNGRKQLSPRHALWTHPSSLTATISPFKFNIWMFN